MLSLNKVNNLGIFIENNYWVFLFICLLWLITVLGYQWKKKQNRKSIFPKIPDDEILFKEKNASGCSHRNIFTRLSSARSCLMITITKDELWIMPSFPFNLMAGGYDLEHRIKKELIKTLKEKKSWGMSKLIITYSDEKGKEHTFELSLKNKESFLKSLGKNVE